MDIYAIICIFTLILQAIWHAIIGSIIFRNTPNNALTPDMWFVTLDQTVLIVSVCLFILMHIALIAWLYAVPFKHLKDMAKKDEEYGLMADKKKNQNNNSAGNNWNNSTFSRMPIQK